jgi:hypothetical protein
MRRKRWRGIGQGGGEIPDTGEGSTRGSGGRQRWQRFGRDLAIWSGSGRRDRDVRFGREKNEDFFAKGWPLHLIRDGGSIYDELEERGEEREERWDLMQELALTRAPRHFVRVSSGSCIYKVVYFCG